jgi:hypothetical protein
MLGYPDTEIDAILRHVVGHGTLARAPGVNHETLRRRGFTDAAIATAEAALADADDLSQVFDRRVLGDAFCRRMLGFTASELADEAFDILAGLGFSDAGIEAANVFCFGARTMEGAPYLDPAHLAVFDCAVPQGERGRRQVSPAATVRMMAAAQPFVSGGIGHSVVMPGAATIDDCRGIFLLAWRLGLKSLVVRGRRMDRPGPLHRADTRIPQTATSISDACVPPTDRRFRSGSAGSHASTRTVIAAGPRTNGGDAETSRGAVSLAARSTASVPSSADAVVEQRQV